MWEVSYFLRLKASLRINVAYNNDPGYFEMVNNSMFEYPAYLIEGVKSQLSYDFEILETFFKTKNVIIKWTNCNFNWGWFDGETGRWTGAVGKVKMNTFLLK